MTPQIIEVLTSEGDVLGKFAFPSWARMDQWDDPVFGISRVSQLGQTTADLVVRDKSTEQVLCIRENGEWRGL